MQLCYESRLHPLFVTGTAYYLLEAGKIVSHKDKPWKNGLRVVATSIDEYVKRYKLPKVCFPSKPATGGQFKMKILSKRVE